MRERCFDGPRSPLWFAVLATTLLCACSPKFSDRHIEKYTLAGGAILTEQSWVETPSICLPDCDSDRVTKLTLEHRTGSWRDLFVAPETIAELRRPAAKSAPPPPSKVARLERAGDIEVIILGSQLYTKWNAEAPTKDRMGLPSWRMQLDLGRETGYFLRNFECATAERPEFLCEPNQPFPGLPYPLIAVDLTVPVARRSRTDAKPGNPAVLVYSAPYRSYWQFDFDATIRENPGLNYHRVPVGLFVEARILEWTDKAIPGRGSFKTPDDVTAQHPSARVILQQTLPALDATWTTVATSCGAGEFSNEFRIPYADPDPKRMMIHTRRTGHKENYADFVRIGEWVGFDGTRCKTTQTDHVVAGFVRIVRG